MADKKTNKQESELVILYSDGGADVNRGLGAGAAILENPRVGKRLNLLLFLGECTNNEAEVSAGLMAFAYFRGLRANGRKIEGVRWVSDSEYTLLSASSYIENWQLNGWRTANKQPVKNQGLWRMYLFLSAGLVIDVNHVLGHTGHNENESCDEAVRWAKKNAVAEFGENKAAHPVIINNEKWFLLDGREFLSLLRNETHGGCSEEAYQMLIEQFKDGGLFGRRK